MSKSRDSRSRRRSQRQRRARLRRLVWARVGPLAQRDPLFAAFYQTAPTVHHLAYNYLICAERAHCSDDKCLRDRGHPGLPPWPEHLARVTFADDNCAISALTAALAVRQFAMRIVADVIALQDYGTPQQQLEMVLQRLIFPISAQLVGGPPHMYPSSTAVAIAAFARMIDHPNSSLVVFSRLT